MFSLTLPGGKRAFDSLSEQEILGLAISSEEDDARIYLAYADQLRAAYPQSAKVFEDMAEVEHTHRNMLIEMHRDRFGDRIPLIRREHVRGFYERKPDWLRKNLTLDQIREEAMRMEEGAFRFYQAAAQRTSDAGIRKLLGDLAMAEQGHEEIATMLGEKHLSEDAVAAEDETKKRQFVLCAAGPRRPNGRFGLDACANFRSRLRHRKHVVDLSDRFVGLGRCGYIHGLHRSRP